ncbi:MAG: ABC transporter permease, partial [Eubacterium sp.]|nr:ABC transporter permease [Eubacterium sp.]
MKNNSIYSMEGVGKVYKFTLTQAFKNKGYRASFIVMILVIVFLGPIMRLGASSGQNIGKSINDVKEDKVNITELLIFNDSGVRIDEEALGFADSGYKNISVSFPAEKDQKIDSVKASLTSTQVLLLLKTDVNESGMPEYKLQLISSDDTEIKPDILDSLGSFLIEKFDNARYEQAGVDKDIMILVSSGFNEKKTYTDEEFTNASNRKYSDMEVVALGTTFAVIIMMVLSLASSYIVSSVMEEKVSKLVETLMISVRPLALVMGKIFAMMTYVLL